MSRVHFAYDDDNRDGLTWSRMGGRVLVKCKCGTLGTLDHQVADNGDVTPSLVCPVECGFHEHVTLDDWPEGKP